jgi:hypothetical protein
MPPWIMNWKWVNLNKRANVDGSYSHFIGEKYIQSKAAQMFLRRKEKTA